MKWGCDARIHQGVSQGQGNNEEERCAQAVWCERWENKENKIEGRNKNYKTSPPTVPYGKQSNAQTDDNVKIFLMPGLSLLQEKKNRNIFCYFILSMNLFSTVS